MFCTHRGRAELLDLIRSIPSCRRGRRFRWSHWQISFTCQLAAAFVTQRIALISQNRLFMERVVKETRGCSRDLGTRLPLRRCLPFHNVFGLVAELLSASDEPNAPTESAPSSKRRGKIAANEQLGTAVRSIARPPSSDASEASKRERNARSMRRSSCWDFIDVRIPTSDISINLEAVFNLNVLLKLREGTLTTCVQ
jgi:hypothetical protein